MLPIFQIDISGNMNCAIKDNFVNSLTNEIYICIIMCMYTHKRIAHSKANLRTYIHVQPSKTRCGLNTAHKLKHF